MSLGSQQQSIIHPVGSSRLHHRTLFSGSSFPRIPSVFVEFYTASFSTWSRGHRPLSFNPSFPFQVFHRFMATNPYTFLGSILLKAFYFLCRAAIVAHSWTALHRAHLHEAHSTFHIYNPRVFQRCLFVNQIPPASTFKALALRTLQTIELEPSALPSPEHVV